MQTTQDTHPMTDRRQRRRAVLIAVVASAALVAAVYLLAWATGHDMVVTPPGQPTGAVPVPAALVAAVVGALLATLGAAIAGRTPRPRTVFLTLGALALGGSFASPFAAAESTETALWLCLMHVSVAAASVPPLLATLGRTR